MRMIKICALLAAFVSLTGSAFGQAGAFKIKSVSPEVLKTPKFQFSGKDKDKGSPRDWLSVEVQFSAEPKFTDEIVVKYYILIGRIVLDGEVTHINIPKEKELYSVIFLSPRTIDQLLEGRPFTAAAIENVAAQLWVKGALVAQETWKPPANAPWITAAGVVHRPGLLLNKNQTPFAPLFWDRYEMIKPEGR
jgi:hypothetical protein